MSAKLRSHLINVVRDTFSHDGARHEKAAAFERTFESSGSVLLLSWHHLQELLSHENEAVIKQRFEYVASKPLVGCLKSLTEESVPGSIIDMQAMEVAAAFKNRGGTLSGVRDVAAARMFTLATGRDTVRPFLESWSPVSEAFEALRQACSKAPLLATILKRVEKAGDYSTIATIVAAQ
jgi:hypothetical protein